MAAVAVACAAWAVWSAWQTVLAAGGDTLRALWLLPGLVCLHLVQLLISALAWRVLLPAPPAGWAAFHRLRLVREGIDSLLPVAQVGGELVGAQLLARQGTALGLAAASVVVDVTLEFVSQLAFLLLGLVTWAALAPAASWGVWLGVSVLAAAVAAGFAAAQGFGLLRLVELLMRQIAMRLPALATVSLDGLHTAAIDLYRRHRAVAGSGGLHLVAWALGTAETWAVLNTLGLDVSPLMALVVESFGMAGRSAGFAVPGALVVQEASFVLAAAAMGLPEAAGLALSLVKRVREVSTGMIGLGLWFQVRRARA